MRYKSIDRRQRTWLYPERHIRAVDNTDSQGLTSNPPAPPTQSTLFIPAFLIAAIMDLFLEPGRHKGSGSSIQD